MIVFPSDDEKAAFVRLLPGDDLLGGLNRAAKGLGFEAATLSILGAVKSLVIVAFDQTAKTYGEPKRYDQMEISGGTGNVSLKDGEPFVHIHVVGAGQNGKAVAGHLIEGSTVYMIEAYFRVLEGTPPVRELDDEIGLPVWH